MHVFVIPDGNRRWERARDLPTGSGHLAGYERLVELLPQVWDLGITHFTFWALSTANLAKRGPAEIQILRKLLTRGIRELGERLIAKEDKVRFRILGDTENHFPEVWTEARNIENATKHHTEHHFTLLMLYDGIWDLTQGAQRFAESQPMQIQPIPLRDFLPSYFLPDVDLMIRTGDEPHLSGAALAIQMANAQLCFCNTLWPDFTITDLETAIQTFKKRPRRFGA